MYLDSCSQFIYLVCKTTLVLLSSSIFSLKLPLLLEHYYSIQIFIQFFFFVRRYNDGDPLSAEDQSFVLQSVFNFHPDKAAKMGAGIDHFMVNFSYCYYFLKFIRFSPFFFLFCLHVKKNLSCKTNDNWYLKAFPLFI